MEIEDVVKIAAPLVGFGAAQTLAQFVEICVPQMVDRAGGDEDAFGEEIAGLCESSDRMFLMDASGDVGPVHAAIAHYAVGVFRAGTQPAGGPWFGRFRLVDRELPEGTDVDVPEFAIMLHGDEYLDCAVEIGRASIDVFWDGYCGWKPVSAEDASRATKLLEWARSNPGGDAAAMQRVKEQSYAPYAGWLKVGADVLHAFEPDAPPPPVREFVEYLKGLEFQRQD